VANPPGFAIKKPIILVVSYYTLTGFNGFGGATTDIGLIAGIGLTLFFLRRTATCGGRSSNTSGRHTFPVVCVDDLMAGFWRVTQHLELNPWKKLAQQQEEHRSDLPSARSSAPTGTGFPAGMAPPTSSVPTPNSSRINMHVFSGVRACDAK